MSIIEKYKRNQEERDIQKANDLFQITECQSELWVTYSGCLVCPCSMLKESPVEAVRKMRELYISRNSKYKQQENQEV